MAETVNVIKSAENGKHPTDSVIKKFERVLGITLMVDSKPEETSRLYKDNSRGLTLGDYFSQNGE
jgi:ribosome-binding protein aMBF1 (putative translation factor)